MSTYSAVTVLKVLKTSHPMFVSQNAGYNGDKTLGIWHFEAYNTMTDQYLIRKPFDASPLMMVQGDWFKENVEPILNIRLYNN